MMMADKKAITGSSQSSTESVVKLLASILDEVQKQVLRKTPKELEGVALQAVEQFKEIEAALALRPLPTITLRAEQNPNPLPFEGGKAKLIWTSTDALTVSIDQNVGEVEPTAGGSIEVFVEATKTFRATAKGPCGSASDEATVFVQGVL
jgi:hypothetical protein